MKRYLWVVALLVVVFAGDRLGGLICGFVVEGSGFRYARLYQGKADADLVFVGNSRGLMFLQPEIEAKTGASTFNISYNALPMDLAQVFLDDYLAQYTAPSTVFMDITMLDRTNPELIASCSPFLPYSERLNDLVLSTNPKSYYGCQVTHLYRYNSELFQRALFYRNQENDEDWLLDRVINAGMLADTSTLKPYTMKLPETMLAAFVETVAALQAKGIKVVLTVNPYLPAFAKSIVNLDEFQETVGNAVGLPVHDFSQLLEDPQLFGDYQHVNKNGARLLIQEMERRGLFRKGE